MPTALNAERQLYGEFQRAFGSGQLQVSGTAWCRYLGFQAMPGRTVNMIEVQLTALSTVDSVGELGIFSSPSGPCQAGQTLTKITASGSLTSMTAGSPPFMVRTAALAAAIPAGTHLWGVTRFATGGTQPTISEGVSHTSLGEILVLAGASALTGISTLAAGLPTMAVANHGCPFMRLVDD